MITIRNEPFGNGFILKFSEPGTGWRGWEVRAANSREIKLAVDHYNRVSTCSPENREKHSQFMVRDCPLCRMERLQKFGASTMKRVR